MYEDYTALDFVKDEFFQDWVLHPNEARNLFWENWLQAHPHQQAVVAEARKMLQAIKPESRVLADEQVALIWDNIQARIRKTKQVSALPPEEPAVRSWGNWYWVAAGLVGFLLAFSAWLLVGLAGKEVVLATRFGETRNVTLPDGSVVVLNGNSSLSYLEADFAQQRDVSLAGEGFFSIVKSPHRFGVQLSGGTSVEVLGTQFVVSSRPRQKRVVLSEGKLQLILPQARTVKGAVVPTRLVLSPGDVVELSDSPQRLVRKRVADPGRYAAFRQNKIVFQDTPLQEVARMLEDTYGYQVRFQDPALAARRFTGSCPADRIDILLSALEKSFSISIARKGKKITIR